MQDAEFLFTYTGNRIYLAVPLFHIPDNDDPIKSEYIMPTVPENHKMASDLTAEELKQHQDDCGGTYEEFLKKIAEGSETGRRLYKFTVGKSALRIRPTEAFQISMNWPNGAVPVEERFKIYVFMHGLMWTPL